MTEQQQPPEQMKKLDMPKLLELLRKDLEQVGVMNKETGTQLLNLVERIHNSANNYKTMLEATLRIVDEKNKVIETLSGVKTP